MNIKKFEAYSYRGKDLDTINRKEFIQEFIDIFIDSNICGYECVGSSYEEKSETLYLHMNKNIGTENLSFKVVKFDFSDMGIEFGTQEWDDENEELGEFVPERNLDTDMIKQSKDIKKSLGKYNI